MDVTQPLLLEDIAALREAILALETQGGRKAQLWRLIKNSARSAPLNYPWFTPFVALITRQAQDIENARLVLRTYISKLDPMSFSTGMQYHFWCFAFPHAKWSLYFQWLCTLGAFAPAEQEAIAQQLIQYHFVNFFYGLRTKPEPECVDNQTLSLALSSALVGYLFAQGEKPSAMAQVMFEEGLRRLPVVVGDMPASGYSGEGSAYMDCVNGPAIPLAVELLERITGERGLLYRRFTAAGGTPFNVLLMTAREWMPGGLLLPWDNYGYQFGVRATAAYGARATGQALFYDILEKECIWSYDIGVGWAYDDLVWTLIWWPERPADRTPGAAGRSWFEPEVGGALLSDDQNFYLMQMWDASAPGIPTRAHVNPNAVLFNGYGAPLSADGSPAAEGCPRFRFPDTFRRVSFLTMGGDDVYNYGDGCGGAHSILLVDGWEGLRLFGEQAQFSNPAGDAHSLFCDVTPTYQERVPDVVTVQRKSTLCAGRFFVVEDRAVFRQPHRLTSRFLLRPEFVPCAPGVKIRTPEGVSLQLAQLLEADEIHTEVVANHPARPDRRSGIADFTRQACAAQRLFVAWIGRDRDPEPPLDEIQALPESGAALDFHTAAHKLAQSTILLPMLLPAHNEMELPIVKTWWYRKLASKHRGPAWLKLPVGLARPQLYLNGLAIDLSPFAVSGELLAPHVPLPAALEMLDEVEIILRTDVPVSHYEGGGEGTLGMAGGMAWCYPVEEEALQSASYAQGVIRLVTNRQVYEAPYQLLAEG